MVGDDEPVVVAAVMALLLLVPHSTAGPLSAAAGSFASTVLGEPQILGGPSGGNFDSSFHAFNLSRRDGSARLVGYSSNQDVYRVLDGKYLTDLVPGPSTIGGLGRPVGLNRSAATAGALDHCGCWLQAAASLPGDPPGRVRGWYHEEWRCDYAHKGYTNKSVAYAESQDGGVTFEKKGWPHNQIIQASGANTTATAARGQQVGEGDHSVAVVGPWIYLFFHEWDSTPGRRTGVGLARSAVSDGGVPGSWKKYHCTSTAGCGFSSPGIGGPSSMVTNISGSVVTWLPHAREFISIGTRGPWRDPITVGHGPQLAFARPQPGEPPVAFQQMAEPLIFADSESWTRSNASRELYAYGSIVSDPLDPSSLWFYYTFLEPSATFHERYFVRRSVTIEWRHTVLRASRVALGLARGPARAGGRGGDWWASTAMWPGTSNYTRVATVGSVLVTGGPNRKRITDCFISEWDDHFVARDHECNASSTVSIRTLGFLLDEAGAAAAKASGVPTLALFRCFDNVTKNHAVSLASDCDSRGKMEFKLGYTITN
jgi:hypothetical protein